MFPKNPKSGNGTLLVDIPNRGRVYAQALYNSLHDEPFESGTTEVGTGFLQDHGFAIAEVMWELGQGADLPTFTDGSGNKHFVEGVGFAIVRDATDFLRNATADSAGTANPLHGAIKHVLASGKSQSGRYLKTFLYNGFNMVGDRRMFDGMHVFVSGAGMLPIMQSGTGPQSSATGAPDFAHPEFPGVHDGVLTIGEIIKHVKERGEKPPLMLMLSSTTDFYSLRASLGRTGGDGGTSDLPLPPNVRMYDIAGASHAILVNAKCDLPMAKLDWSPVSRATLLHLDDWVAKDINPPPSRLMPLEPANGDKTVLQAPEESTQGRDPDSETRRRRQRARRRAAARAAGAARRQCAAEPAAVVCLYAGRGLCRVSAHPGGRRRQARQPQARAGALQDPQRLCEPDPHRRAQPRARRFSIAGGCRDHHPVGGREPAVAIARAVVATAAGPSLPRSPDAVQHAPSA